MTDDRRYSAIDSFLIGVDGVLRTVIGRPLTTARPDPAAAVEAVEMTSDEKRRATRLMRVNHTGEVCAQALYQGQALTARSVEIKESMRQAAAEENDHLVWCEARLKDLNGRTSALNPLFYAGSFALGAVAGALGDRVNLGFLAETENQVVRHLGRYADRLPARDYKSRAVLEAMRVDEGKHATAALEAGGMPLPGPVRLLMQAGSKLMTKTTYWL
ncbi:MAG: 2-polyprenyl-3-methyl-6-methoxy-1,4-benzoquinone monooxygenase [Gammaproteobacteria bacterium]